MERDEEFKPETLEDVKRLLAEWEKVLRFEDRGDVVVANVKQFLGKEGFARLASTIRRLGGRYVSEQDKWRFVIPKAAVKTIKLPDFTKVADGTLLKVPLSIIQTGKYYVRRHLDPHQLSRLRESVRRNGDVTYPLATHPLNSSTLEVLGGHRRLQACREAALPTVSVRVFHPTSEREKWEIALQDEMHEPWSPMAKARAYKRMLQEGISMSEITTITGEPYETIKTHLALNQLPEEVQTMIDRGRLGVSFGLSLLKLKDDPKECFRLAEQSVEKAWTRRKLEDEISKIQASSAKTGVLEELPVTLGETSFSENRHFPRGTGSPIEKAEIEKELQNEVFQKHAFTQPQALTGEKQSMMQTLEPKQAVEVQRDAAWDLALKYYPLEMVDLVWEKVAAQGKR
ncbi:MAG: ParB/RepB/Spo0J family partition protein, partial [Candidatus Hecatellaceae archaeon]